MSARSTLTAAADERKAKLAALKAKSLKRKEPPLSSNDETLPDAPPETEVPKTESPLSSDVTRIYLSGRNYDAESKGPRLGLKNRGIIPSRRPSPERFASPVQYQNQ